MNTGLTNTIVWALAVSTTEAGDTVLFAGTNDGVFSSTNSGTGWTLALASTTVRVLAVSPRGTGGTDVFAGTEGDGIYLSTDNGTTWTAVNNGLASLSVWALTVSPNGAVGAHLFAGTSGGGVSLSTNNGADWTSVNKGLTNLYVTALAVVPHGGVGTNLFAGTGSPPVSPNGIFRSTDNGANWTMVLTSSDVTGFAVIDSNAFAAIYGSGIRLSGNGGTSWAPVNTGLTNRYVEALAISGTNLFAGAVWVWRRPLSEMITSVEPPSADVPGIFSLAQNYPNPFNPSTILSFTIPHSSFVVLKVYNILGQEVRTLVDEKMEAGPHHVQFNAEDLPSGVYMYRIESGGQVVSRKMVLVH